LRHRYGREEKVHPPLHYWGHSSAYVRRERLGRYKPQAWFRFLLYP